MLCIERSTADFDAAKLAPGLDDDPADRLVPFQPLGLELDARAHRLQSAHEAHAGLVQADVLDDEAPGKRARDDACDRERCGGDIAGKSKVERRQSARWNHAHRRLGLFERHAEMVQKTLGMIPRLGAARDDGFGRPLQSGEEQSRHRLRAVEFRPMIDRAEHLTPECAQANGHATIRIRCAPPLWRSGSTIHSIGRRRRSSFPSMRNSPQAYRRGYS